MVDTCTHHNTCYDLMKFWTYLKIRIVRFSYNTLSLCCTLLLCCIPYLGIETNIHHNFYIHFCWGGGNSDWEERNPSVSPPLSPSFSKLIPNISIKHVRSSECHNIMHEQIKLWNVAHCSKLLKNTHLLTANQS